MEACIFDLDGVIVDTAKYHYLAWEKLAKELGFNFSKKDNERLKGVSRMRSLDILLEIGNLNLNNSEKIELAKKKNSWYVEYISKMTPEEILPGVVSFLKSLKDNGIKTAIGSASKNALTIIERTDLLKYFDTIIDGNKVSEAKPNPEVFLKAAKELNIKIENSIVFEDAKAGIEAAKNGGFYCIGIGSADILYKANRVIPDFKNFTIANLAVL
ncbi:MAG: beta-phosphoglucomutase [Bacteroidales bacterium]|nr:beta-phosphoglucomutase [Bacteroidales bacterium]MBN2756629.1 beta-phosphoglucomutase [Bacteroidales bacterium]